MFPQVSKGPDGLPPSSPDTEVRGDLPKAESDENTQQVSSSARPMSTAHSSDHFHIFVVTSDVANVALVFGGFFFI